MIRVWRDLSPVLGLFFAERPRALLGGLLLAATTILCGVGLLGLSGWFITATALAGLSTAAALVFDVFMPSAGIRLLALGRTASRYAERLVTHDATLGVLAALRERLFRGWAAPGAARLLLRQPARLLFRLTADVDALDALYLRVVAPLAAAGVTALAVGIGLAFVDARLATAICAALLVAGLGIPLLAARAARKPVRRRAAGVEALRSRTIDLVRGQTELVMAGRLDAQRAAIVEADARLAQADDQLNRIECGVIAGFGLTTALLLAGTLLGVALLSAEGLIGAPVAALAVLVAAAAVEPFAGLRRGALELGRTLLAARRLRSRLAPVADVPPSKRPCQDLAVRLSEVDVRHPQAARPVLQGIDLTVGRGERVALIGASGAGKSTLLALLAGEIEAEAGEALRLEATLLTQATELFRDTVRDNLRLAAPAADTAALERAVHLAGLSEVVAALPLGLDTPLGEGGLGLSGGQSRRLALARLLLRDTPLWLLDEPTEGLDRATARDLLARLSGRFGDRTVVIATHIRREAALADRLLMLADGRIAAEFRRGDPSFAAALEALRED